MEKPGGISGGILSSKEVGKYFFSFSVVLLFIIIYGIYKSDLTFYHDSAQYWNLGKTFVDNNDFSILNYKEPLRGYLLPLCNFFTYLLSTILHVNEITLFRILNSLFIAFFISVLIPSFFSLLFKKEISLVQNLSFAFLIVFFWRGYFLYPLSDFPALFFIFAGLYLILLLNKRLESMKIKILNIVICLVVGICISASTNIRPTYQITIIPFFLLLFICFYTRDINLRTGILYTVCTLVGLLICYVPQLYINYYNFHIISPFVPTEIAYGGRSLFLNQINWGISLQKYETNIGSNFPQPQINFIDNQGLNILMSENINSITSIGQYIILLAKYPFDFMCIYFRHFFNGLDITYSSAYVENVYKSRIIFSLLNYSLWFLFSSIIIKKLKNFTENKIKSFMEHKANSLMGALIYLILVSPAIISIVGAVEIRFFLPFYIICYATICYYSSFGSIRQRLRKTQILDWIALLIFIVICFTLTANTFSNLQNGIMLLGN